MNLTNKELSIIMPGYALPVKKRAKTSRKEEHIQTAFSKWFKSQYSDFPFKCDEVVQKRSFVAQNVLKSQQFKAGHPDINIQVMRMGYGGLYIEQKKSFEELFYIEKERYGMMRPGSNNHFIDQEIYMCHLREQGYFATFSTSLEQSIDFADKYMSNMPIKHIEVKYEYNAKTMMEYMGCKHFKPVDLF